mmetsp:Transcript_47794/g.104027  ORF Transcript_47794/g.104027 Transcript_47794/m.104027 type:complete len:92 (-) Transcript_47794:241-516(-)
MIASSLAERTLERTCTYLLRCQQKNPPQPRVEPLRRTGRRFSKAPLTEGNSGRQVRKSAAWITGRDGQAVASAWCGVAAARGGSEAALGYI